MTTVLPNSYRKCATCAYWTGFREVDNHGLRVILDTADEKGRCAIPRGAAKGRQQPANNASCRGWNKWPVLK